MLKKLLEKLAHQLIMDAYLEGHGDGYKLAKDKYTKGQFKKGCTPWNKGKKKGVKNGK